MANCFLLYVNKKVPAVDNGREERVRSVPKLMLISFCREG